MELSFPDILLQGECLRPLKEHVVDNPVALRQAELKQLSDSIMIVSLFSPHK